MSGWSDFGLLNYGALGSALLLVSSILIWQMKVNKMLARKIIEQAERTVEIANRLMRENADRLEKLVNSTVESNRQVNVTLAELRTYLKGLNGDHSA